MSKKNIYPTKQRTKVSIVCIGYVIKTCRKAIKTPTHKHHNAVCRYATPNHFTDLMMYFIPTMYHITNKSATSRIG